MFSSAIVRSSLLYVQNNGVTAPSSPLTQTGGVISINHGYNHQDGRERRKKKLGIPNDDMRIGKQNEK